MVSCDLSQDELRWKERGKRIRNWRESQSPRCTQDALAETLGVSVTTIRSWENGHVEHLRRGKDKLLELMGCTDIWLEYGPVRNRPESSPTHSPPVQDKAAPEDEQVLLNAETLVLLGQYGPELPIEALKSISTFIKYLHHREADKPHEHPTDNELSAK